MSERRQCEITRNGPASDAREGLQEFGLRRFTVLDEKGLLRAAGIREVVHRVFRQAFAVLAHEPNDVCADAAVQGVLQEAFQAGNAFFAAFGRPIGHE